jgi:glucose-6-phosphate dehydrogenase assembly protein OpcA
MNPATDAVWSEEGTTPDAIEAALRELVKQRHSENGSFVPARALNMIAFVDSAFSGEIANRLRGVGRYHASRTIVFSYEPDRTRLDARAIVTADSEPGEGELGLLRETVIVEIGERHLDDLVTIADPLVVTDLATLLWSPHGHEEAVNTLLELSQAVLVDSVEDPSYRDAVRRACELGERAYVVDLAWLRSTPWRERLASAFDPPAMRAELRQVESIAVRHHRESTAAALLMVGWLASRLGWEMRPLKSNGRTLAGSAVAGTSTTAGALTGDTMTETSTTVGGEHGDRELGHRNTVDIAARMLDPDIAGRMLDPDIAARMLDPDIAERTIAIRLEQAPELEVRGLQSVAISTSSGRRLGLQRGEGGLRARSRDEHGREREWTILGASRGEGGILGEGIRQALLRDPTYQPALQAAATMTP